MLASPRSLSRQEREELLALQEERAARERQRALDRMFPATGPFRRDLYPRQMEHFAAGAIHRERLFMAGNRCGKTTAGAYETALHVTGRYPDWWVGKRFDEPVNWWAAGRSAETTRDIVQLELFGPVAFTAGRKGFAGTRMVPGELITGCSWKGGAADLADVVTVRHVSGGMSRIGLKTYSQGRGAFEGTAQHGIWIDEEPDIDVYTEAVMRTMTTNGIIILTFTPMEGMSDVVMAFLEDGRSPNAKK